ncbi:MAG: MmcQ/YjbR family DNA-binding protein [Xanthomonadales bacterium]|nr:MmcQ/YjbR family DNA-binding protein [Xanthomonadales bacterium]
MNETALRRFCADWPGVVAEVKWQDQLVFSVGGKMFAVFCLRGAQAGHLSFRVGPERFLEFTDRPGLRPAPYLARAHWVQRTQPEALAMGELKGLLRGSYNSAVSRLTRAQRSGLAQG